jgi:hypothetical protein
MKMAVIILGIILVGISCGNHSGKGTSSTSGHTIDTAAAKDLDTASEIMGSGMVHP